MTSAGKLLAIFTAPRRAAPMQAHEAIQVLLGAGLEGDRYALRKGALSRWGGPHREVTFIAREDLERMAEVGVLLPAVESRRNLLVEGVDLAALIKRPFRVGEAVFMGVQACQPCKYLVRITGREDLLPAMIGRGGLRARVMEGGMIRVGDAIEEVITSR